MCPMIYVGEVPFRPGDERKVQFVWYPGEKGRPTTPGLYQVDVTFQPDQSDQSVRVPLSFRVDDTAHRFPTQAAVKEGLWEVSFSAEYGPGPYGAAVTIDGSTGKVISSRVGPER